ncbi:TPA: hypothetical protein L9C83_005112 [Klebsiella quasipneumoniae]|nr:hypothetical protein [Klebsiella quasipneumoniae]HBQ9092670.1 hypothetical protein [Klebsiella quasipneumoniae]HBQ9098381.1 hypothetical protein [Klebsiella quasipneumoniae]HBQ9115238.1 hypothetical protein [Klebsiella quasipneumoniae]
MDRFNRIPFGLEDNTQQFVDVHDVKNGRKCGCVCPSCRLPLVARQGKKNDWHFAHASRKVHDIDQECDFSFFVSVRAMAKQIISSGFSLSTPALTGIVNVQRNGLAPLTVEFTITKSTVITLSDVHKEYLFEDTLVDLCGDVNGHTVIIYFTHPERFLPVNLSAPEMPSVAILNIDLTRAMLLFRSKIKKGFIAALEALLGEETENKKWVYHPRQEVARIQAREKLLGNIEGFHKLEPHSRLRPELTNTFRLARYICIECREPWEARSGIEPMCPTCGSKLCFRKWWP